MSLLNAAYLISVRPMHTSKENRIEIFNELTIFMCATIMTCFLDVAMPVELRNLLGWVLMGVSGFNIFVNLCITCTDSFKDMWEERNRNKYAKKAAKVLELKLKNREKLLETFPGYFTHFANEQAVIKVIQFCKEWIVHRQWLKSNHIKFKDFAEEKKYQRYVKKLNLNKRVEDVKMTRAFEYAAVDKATEKYNGLLVQRGKDKREERSAKAYEKLTGKPKEMAKAVGSVL